MSRLLSRFKEWSKKLILAVTVCHVTKHLTYSLPSLEFEETRERKSLSCFLSVINMEICTLQTLRRLGKYRLNMPQAIRVMINNTLL